MQHRLALYVSRYPGNIACILEGGTTLKTVCTLGAHVSARSPYVKASMWVPAQVVYSRSACSQTKRPLLQLVEVFHAGSPLTKNSRAPPEFAPTIQGSPVGLRLFWEDVCFTSATQAEVEQFRSKHLPASAKDENKIQHRTPGNRTKLPAWYLARVALAFQHCSHSHADSCAAVAT